MIVVDQEKCIGCNTCPMLCPECFKLDEETYKAKVICNGECECADMVISSCPVGAITSK